MKKTLAVVLLSVFCAVPAFADMQHKDALKGTQKCECHEHDMQMCDMHGMHKRGDMLGMFLRHADKLGLSPDQVAKLKSIHTGMEKKRIQLDADLKIARIDLRQIMEVKDFDLDKADAQVQKISDIQKNKRLEMVKSIKEVRSVLTDDQFKKMHEMMHRMWEGKKHGMPEHKEHH